MRNRRLLVVLPLLVVLSGCGGASTPKAAKAPPPPKVASKPAVQKAPAQTKASTPAKSSTAAPTPPATVTTAPKPAAGPVITLSSLPKGATVGPSVLLSIKNLPTGWTLTELAFESTTGLKVAETPSQAMYSTPPASQGSFSMGQDGQILTFFYPDPPGKWAGTKCRFVLTFKTKAGASAKAESALSAFPGE